MRGLEQSDPRGGASATLEDEKQKAFFMKGVEEANGWLEYEVVEKGETISYVENNMPISRVIP